LNIKSPTSDEDKCLSTSLDSTVKDVKCQIEKEWDSHPSPKDQRLVYAGKMLENNSILREVLRLEDARDENDAFTIHLICRNSIHTPTSPPNSTIKTGQNSDQNSNLRRRNNVETSPINSSTLPSNAATLHSTNDGQTWNNTPATADQQAILMQQVYANYMTQYVQYLQSIGALNGVTWPNQTVGQSLVEQTNQIADEARAGGAAMAPGPQPPVFDHVHAAAAVAGAAVANHNLQQQQPPAVQPQPQAQINQHNVQNDVINANQVPVENNNMGPDGPNVVMNAGAGGIGAMEDEDDLNGGQRDVLDWCYVVTRVLVLFSVVYFYSSLARFALAAGLGIIFYLYNNGFFGQPQRRPQEQDQNQQNHEAAVNEVRQVAGAAGDRGAAEGQQPPAGDEGQAAGIEPAAPGNEAASEAARVGEDIPQPQIHPLNVLSTFVTTFFTSLLPNDPQVV